MARKLFPGEKMSIYQCGSYWHFGHQSPLITQGKADRRKLYR